MRHWNRGRRTVRNLLLALLLAFLIYASQGFPPYTVKGMCRQVRNDYLLGEVEPLYVQRDRPHLSSSSTLHLTNVAARSGDTYLFFSYRDTLLGSRRDWSAGFSTVFGEGSACVARAGKIYAAGPFGGAAPAAAWAGRRRSRSPTAGCCPGSSPWRGPAWQTRSSSSPMTRTSAISAGTRMWTTSIPWS